MWLEFETLKLSKFADEEMLMAINIMLQLLGDGVDFKPCGFRRLEKVAGLGHYCQDRCNDSG